MSVIQMISIPSRCGKRLLYFLLLVALSACFNQFTAHSAQISTRIRLDDIDGRAADSSPSSIEYKGTTKASATSVGVGIKPSDRITSNDASTMALQSVRDETTKDAVTSAGSVEAVTTEQQADLGNATLLIEYDQQGYNLKSTSAPAEATSQISSIAKEETASVEPMEKSAPKASQSVPSKAESLDARSRPDEPIEARASAPLRSQPETTGRGLRDMVPLDKVAVNASNIYQTLFKKKPYSKFWTVEQKWDDIFKRFMVVQNSFRSMMMKNFFREIQNYADVTMSPQCVEDLRFIQNYVKESTNIRWLTHMFDAFGKSEPGMLTGNLAELGHVVQCVRVRAPSRLSNETFDERFFELQAETLGERFRGKYCLASVRPVMPEKPRLISRFHGPLNESLLSNISYMGESNEVLKQRSRQTSVPKSVADSIDRSHYVIDQVPFESELYQYLIAQRNFMFSLPRFMGVCYPSTCTQDDIRYSLQKTLDDQHQVVDLEFKCEVDEPSAWDWYNTQRLIAHVFLFLVVLLIFSASLARYILVDKLQIKRRKNLDDRLSGLVKTLDFISLDKCVGVLFVKTKRASPITDLDKPENNRSTSIDALKGFLTLILVYCQLVQLGCLPVPFMWSKWSDAMFPFYRSWITQFFLNTTIWTEAFYTISAYLIGLKLLENYRPKLGTSNKAAANRRLPDLVSFAVNRYVKLVMPMVAFIVLNYVWPRLSNGFAMQDQAEKLMTACDNYGWTNLLMFHNHNNLNETCLWPSHVSATFFQLHLLSYPILVLLLVSLRNSSPNGESGENNSRAMRRISLGFAACLMLILAVFGVVYPAYVASNQELIVPFLIDYLDFDNYQRVIEWMVMPTYNHLTSYMIGLAMAYLVAKRRADCEARRPSGTDSIGVCWNMDRESSLESIDYSSTQKLDHRPTAFKGSVEMLKLEQLPSDIYGMHLFNNRENSLRDNESWWANLATSLLANSFVFVLIVLSLTASWFWNGLGQPMTTTQTFWYMCSTKTVFSLAFAYMFYKHFATRRNSMDAWMITRFLVPIGRMSLMVFYMSWLVTWFDLLASLYQWHPSHYFICEKFNEIIFMTLVLSLFAYGAFEGSIAMSHYAEKREELKQKATNGISPDNLQGFDHLFSPLHSHQVEINPKSDNLANSYQDQSRSPVGLIDNATNNKSSAQQLANPNLSSIRVTGAGGTPTNLTMPSQVFNNNRSNKSYVVTSSPSGHTTSAGRHLSIADQYKLNAELRANYSFASIGLYESAGAIGDLPSSSDPQVSPEPSIKHRR